MEDIYKVLKSNQCIQGVHKSLELSSKISEMFKAQDNRIAKSFSGISMVSEIAKNFQQHSIKFNKPTLSAIESLSKSISLQTKALIPQTTIDAIPGRQNRYSFKLLAV